MADLSTITLPSGDTYNLKDNNAVPSSEKATANGVATLDANGLIPQSQVPGMVILSYGNNTWDDFLAAYQKNNVIYCRASSNSNPASGSQTRLAFMAYVNNATSPTEVEFQYYRSVSSHNATQQGDQVYVYKLNKNSGWSVTTRESYTRVVTNNGLTSTWSSGVLTASADIVSTTKLNNAATAAIETAGRVYPVALDTNGKLAVNVPWESGSSLQWTIDNDGTGESSLQAVVQNDVVKNVASGNYANAEGSKTTASGNYSHSENYNTSASATASHAEGSNTTASGNSSHSEGVSTVSSGNYSHAEGFMTTANHQSQHVFGECNIADPSSAAATARGTYVEIVGNGNPGVKSNARTLDWSGNEVLAGKLTVGTGPTNNMDVATKQYVDTHSGGGAVRYDEAQSLTSAQKSQARSNIEASGMIDSTITAKNYLVIPNGTSGQSFTIFNLVLGANQDFNGYGEMWSWGESKNLLTTIQDGANGNVTWTANPNGSVSMHGIAYSSSMFGFRNVTLSPGTYIFSGFSPEYLDRGRFLLVNPSNQVIGEDRGGGFQFTISAQMSLGVNFQPYAGVNMEGITLYPMICSANDSDPYTYVPYCNISLINGRTSAAIDQYGASSEYHLYTISLGGDTVYGASLNVITGEMTVTHGFADISNFGQSYTGQSTAGLYIWAATIADISDAETGCCSMLHRKSVTEAEQSTTPCYAIDSGKILVYAADSTWAKFSARYKFLQFAYQLSSSTTAQLTPTQVTMFGGENQLFIEDCYITTNIKQDVADYAAALEERVDALEMNSSSLQWTIDSDGSGQTSLQATVQNDIANNVASGTYSHAEGTGTTASGNYGSHAEGGNSDATADCAHAEGWDTWAAGGNSHAEGCITHASGANSHAEGEQTRAYFKSQHVFGEWNMPDSSSASASQRGNYVEIVGNGTSENARSNARTLDWSGNEVLSGKLTVGAAPTNNMDVATKQYVDGKIEDVKDRSSQVYTNDVLSDSLLYGYPKFFIGNGSNYTGVLPTTSGSWAYAAYLSIPRSSTRFVMGWGYDGYIATNTYNGTTWSGWKNLRAT